MPWPISHRTLLFAGLATAGLLVVVLVVIFLSPGRPIAKYQPSDRNTTAGEISEWNFDADSVGKIPSGLAIFGGNWEVRPEADAPSSPNVLCQTGTASFPALSLSDKVYTDLVVTTRFKPISGRTDQAAGIIFRVQDKDNYYVLRANALANVFTLVWYSIVLCDALLLPKEQRLVWPVVSWFGLAGCLAFFALLPPWSLLTGAGVLALLVCIRWFVHRSKAT